MSPFFVILLSFILAKTILLTIAIGTTFLQNIQIPLYHLPKRLFPLKSSIATVTCILHAFSPAGIFLLSGNTESLFNFLSFSGMALFHKDYRVLPALIWCLAGTVRSNAILWSGFFAWDAINILIETSRPNILKSVGKVVYLGVCSIISIGGFVWWQYSAWQQYCTSSTPQEWCT